MTESELLFATPNEVALEIAHLIKQARIELNKTQKQFAEELGIPHATYRLFEQSGKSSFTNVLKVLIKLGHKSLITNALKKNEIEKLGIDAFVKQSSKKQRTKVYSVKSNPD